MFWICCCWNEGGLTAKYTSHHFNADGFAISAGGLAAGVMTFVAYGYFTTKIRK